MKRISILIAICVMSLTTVAFAQKHTQHISFDDNLGPGNAGTYSPDDHFSVDLYLTFNGYIAFGYSLWLETTADAAPHISLTGLTYGTTFPDPTQPFAGPIGFTLLQPSGRYTTPNPSDLGATVNPPYPQNFVPPGTYFLGNLSISLSGLAPGIYTLQTDATSPHGSMVSSYDGTTFADNDLPLAIYTITIVPEPSTFALLILTVIAVGTSPAGAQFRKNLIRKFNPADQ